MQRSDSLYVDDKLRAASSGATFTVINPATEEPLVQMAAATEQDVDAAIAAAQRGSLEIKDYLDVKYTNMVLM